jgi:hypothetical protein
MESRSIIHQVGLSIVLMLILMPVSPVLASDFESTPVASTTLIKIVERPDMRCVSSALCEIFDIECKEETKANGIYIDPGVENVSPQWVLVMLGSTKQREDILKFIDGLDVSKEKKAGWRSNLEAVWKQYPVRTVQTENGLAVTIVPEKNSVQPARSENSALQEIDAEIGRAMKSSLDGECGVRWNGDTHGNIIMAACVHQSVDETLAGIAKGTAPEPDGWYNDLPEPQKTLERCYNHGYVPPLLPPPPGVPMGLGAAPANCQKNATDAATAYYYNQLPDAFASLGHSSHFMTDIGNPMHTGRLFEQGAPTVMGWQIHYEYENYISSNWNTLGFNETVYDTTEMEVWGTPHSSTQILGWKTQWYRDPLILLVTTNYLAHNQEFHLEEDEAIRALTVSSLVETTKHTNGLVYYVIKDGIRTHIINATAGPHGTISPSGEVQVHYGDSQTFTITPDDGYAVDDILVDGESRGAHTTYTFEEVESNHTIEATFKESAGSMEWIWSRDGWDGWSHEASWSGTEVGPCTEYGPVIVDNHGEHGTEVRLRAGSTNAYVQRQFMDASGEGWNTLTFTGLIAASDVPGGRWMKIEVNDQQVFAGTASQVPPGNGQMFQISVPFPQSDDVNVRISHGQDPAWHLRFEMQYHSLNLTLDHSQRDLSLIDSRDAQLVLPDRDLLVTNGTTSR